MPLTCPTWSGGNTNTPIPIFIGTLKMKYFNRQTLNKISSLLYRTHVNLLVRIKWSCRVIVFQKRTFHIN